ncbi:hypothetical protein NDI54_06180 [Haloarcula sp. S1AR25-5A]|uniref:Nucleotide-diphospho-sugar transferase n=1 Tax=Haloarcula terrestris TaxID=2950533 RepID=A0AAE4JG05_9EURY|nr:hypothetical protein [Haloarcula terrestris]MDS0220938.1 hypothetical protein [Haloarcula terrestris]
MVDNRCSTINETRYVYTVSSVQDLVNQAIISIKSLSNFVDPSDIIVFFTPPIKDKDVKSLKKLGVDVREIDHYASAMAKVPGGVPRYFADKLHLCSVRAKSVVFLDADTIVLDDPTEIITRADLRARPGNLNYSITEWDRIAVNQSVNLLEWMPNTGVLAFNNGSHQIIEQKWADALAFGSKTDKQWTEQHALAVAASELDVSKLSNKEHVMLWRDEYPFDGVVYHSGDKWQAKSTDSMFSKFYRYFNPFF